MPHEMRLTVRCVADESHAKILRFPVEINEESMEKLMAAVGAILDGTARCYIHKPGAGSPIGRCACCGGALKSIYEKVKMPDAKPKRT
jgi:hypothetical protein